MTLQSNLIELPQKDWTKERFKEVDDWLTEQFGRGTWLLAYEKGYHNWRAFYWPARGVLQAWFENPTHALMFKLVWAGY